LLAILNTLDTQYYLGLLSQFRKCPLRAEYAEFINNLKVSRHRHVCNS